MFDSTKRLILLSEILLSGIYCNAYNVLFCSEITAFAYTELFNVVRRNVT